MLFEYILLEKPLTFQKYLFFNFIIILIVKIIDIIFTCGASRLILICLFNNHQISISEKSIPNPTILHIGVKK